ncbi:PA2169 family four-helix-bundle protein [Thalassoglobus sp.]|uniref:PA2169 family four-helix-bundle protein n=1 Tax=Thalassoglobus sp. TaxID=2795869 RepID=UPI003AA84DAE
MALETKADLNKNTIEGLEQLVQMNIDSADGFDYAAKNINSGVLKVAFKEIGQQRREQADELATYLTINDETVNRSGSYAAALHRCWMKCRELMTSNDAHAVVAEAERGEDQIKEAYEEILRQTAGSAVNDILTRQYASVKATHDQIRDLRDSLADD